MSAETLSAFLRGVGLDRYDIMARLRPALLAILPVCAVVACRVPEARTTLGAVAAVPAACGLTYLLAQIARRRGRSLEQRMGDRAGSKHSARLLTFGDRTIPNQSKTAYHVYLRKHGRPMSTEAEEKADPDRAYDQARASVEWLLKHTRPVAKKTLLFAENIAYGFIRNLCGLKSYAITLIVASAIANAIYIFLDFSHRQAVGLGVGLEILLLVDFLTWIFVIDEKAVADASLAYARQLFSTCEEEERLAVSSTEESKRDG